MSTCAIFKISAYYLCVICTLTTVNSLNFIESRFEKPSLQVQTASGTVQGTRLTSEALKAGYYYAYMGIPYAQPPVGPLRFKAPKWANNWSGVLDGTREAPGCVEIRLRMLKPSEVVGVEDCLFINVFTKYNPKKTKRLRPVMFFIYGGAFIEGNTELAANGPDLLISKDVVFVDFNYRMGPYGFLSTEDLASPGNYGLKDQNLALRWVQKNIRMFGGDPDNVTIFGPSAGAVSVHFHMLSPKSKGLFHKAILQSGSVLCHWGSQRKPRNIAALLGVVNGITQPRNNEDLIEKLREIPSEELKQSLLGNILASAPTLTVLGIPFSPSVEPEHEDAFISNGSWYEMLNDGNFNRVPVLLGTTPNETEFYYKFIKMIRPLLIAYDLDRSFLTPPSMNISNLKTTVEVGSLVTEHFLENETSFLTASMEKLLKYTTMEFFTRPIAKTAVLMARHVPLYLYYFCYEGIFGSEGIDIEGQHKNVKGVAHTEELYYVINRMGLVSHNKTDHLVRNRLLTLWTNFAKFGNPTPVKQELLSNIIWPKMSPSSSENYKLEHLEINGTLKVKDTFNEQAHLEWWENLFEKYAIHPLRTY